MKAHINAIIIAVAIIIAAYLYAISQRYSTVEYPSSIRTFDHWTGKYTK